MKLDFLNTAICKLTKGYFLAHLSDDLIVSISYDTRKISQTKNVLFCALRGEFRNGKQFIHEAYHKGIRNFLVDEKLDITEYSDANFICVEDSLYALQEIAKAHRLKFSYPIVGITGSVGKTMVKEWCYHFLSPQFRVIRSPKSFNSQLGVALSLLDLTEECDVALIEVGVSKPNEMKRLEEIVKPSIGIFTSFGSAHKENFQSKEEHLAEKLKLFISCKHTFVHSSIHLKETDRLEIKGEYIASSILFNYENELPFKDNVTLHNLDLAVRLAADFSVTDEQIRSKIQSLPRLALRMETFEGINGNSIINDTYNLDFDALTQSLEYQLSMASNRKRVVLIGLDQDSISKKEEINTIISPFKPDKVIFVDKTTHIPSIENSVILIKGARKADMQRVARQFRLKNHKTYLEIDLNAIRNNLSVFKSYLKPETKLLAMVKSNSYGSGTERMAQFYEQQGINYLGVAYVDEGVELRKQGIKLPILVMNAEEEGFEDCLALDLEPAIYSFSQLDCFIKELIIDGKTDFPIHIKLNTGMTRLGFEVSEIPQLIETLQAQPEVKVKTVYSHLADSDNFESSDFTNLQIDRFKKGCSKIEASLNYQFDRHILNSEAISRFSEVQFEMVRLGIGMYGYSSNPELKSKLKDSIFWKSSVSQIKMIQKGDSVGYGRTFIAEEEMKIGIIPVGYADGFRRSLSNGKGSIWINGNCCKVVGRVCMDMIMVNVSGLSIQEGDAVEIIGDQQTMEDFASKMETIPYEVMTSFSRRVHRVYIES